MTLSVIGAGFGRTGTLSLKLALEQLGFGPCHHMVEVFKDPAAPGRWEAAADGQSVDWSDVLRGFSSTVDWPSATFYRELAEAFPQAKVILTVRDPQAWFASTQATIFARPYDDQNDPFQRMVGKVVGRLFDHRLADRDKVIEVFERHNETVRRTIPADRLLVYDVAQGWEPLCAFLGVPVPETPMPKVNSTEEFLSVHAEKLAAMNAPA